MKAEVCQQTINELADITAANAGVQTNTCSVLTSQVFQSYSWFVQDL